MIKIYKLAAVLLLFILGACSDDTPAPEPGQTGSIENEGEARVTVLHLTSAGTEGWEPVCNADFRLVDPVGRHTFTFTGALRHDPSVEVLGNKGAATCRIAIGADDIPDGTYYLSVSGDGVPPLGMRKVHFSSNIGSEETDTPMAYDDLEGEGTQEHPYLINDAGDFLTLLWYLDEDPTHAYGRYFRQTSSFEVPRRSQIIDGHIWAPVTFSGNYDGAGHELTSLTYQGASDPQADSNIGLFKDLYSATVENLSLTGALVVNAHSNVGLLAGSAAGNTYLSDITISGSVIASGNNIGGVIGAVDGNLSIEGVALKSLVVSGSDTQGENIGGIIGSLANGSLIFLGLSTPDHIFSISGHDKVGGIIGSVDTTASIEIGNATLEHSVDRESSGVKVIYGAGKYTGGLIGQVQRAHPITIDRVSVKAPVRGVQDVGGLFGHAERTPETVISNTTLSSVVSGSLTIGGFFGYLGLPDNNATLRFAGQPNTTRYIIKSSAAADVEGNTHVGGLIGYFEGNHGKVTFDNPVEVAVNVSGHEDTGGAVGYMRNIDGFNLDGVDFSSATMRVTASGQNAGGFFGKAEGCTISGPVKLDLEKGIPSAASLPSNFSGVVNSPTYAGGIAGYFSGTLTGAGSAAQVTTTKEWAGGICGYFDGTIKHCVFRGNVSSPGGVAGIYAHCTKQIYVSDCLNFADIEGGSWQGGITAYTRAASANTSIRIDRTYNCGNLTGGSEVGGIAGYVGEAHPESVRQGENFIDITNCGNSGDIKAAGASNHSVAGIVGRLNYLYCHVYYCANHGNVGSTTVQEVIGGVVGEVGFGDTTNWNTISQCMNSGEITCDVSSTKIGGVVGHIHSGLNTFTTVVCDSYNIGSLPSNQKDDTGGILGYTASNTDTYRTFNRGKVSHGNAIIGTHTSASVFHHSHNYYLEGTGGSWPSSTSVKKEKIGDKSVYSGFDFDNIWQITSDGPVLRHCLFQNIR